jgi:potassium-transporting ATPase KdpC subunit
MRRQFVAALRMLVVLTIVTGVIYPLAVTGIAQLTMKSRADGSLVSAEGREVGSSLIGQAFTGDQWFQGRPDAYDPTASAASNLGPSNPDLATAAKKAAAAVRARNGLSVQTPLPVDAVTTSGSGLDPNISPAYARLQAPRVARVRGLSVSQVLSLIDQHTTGRSLGILGEPTVNVLELNVALERLASGT